MAPPFDSADVESVPDPSAPSTPAQPRRGDASRSGCGVPVWSTITSVAVLAAAVSMGGGLYLYFNSKNAIEARVREQAQAELLRLTSDLRESFIQTEEQATALKNSTTLVAVSYNLTAVRDASLASVFGFVSSKARTSGRVSGSGALLYPTAGLNGSQPDEVASVYVWWDPLAGGRQWFGTRRTILRNGSLHEPVHRVDSVTGEFLEVTDLLNTQAEWEHCDGIDPSTPGRWSQPSTWLKEDGKVALYVFYATTYRLTGVPGVSQQMTGCAEGEMDLVHWDPLFEANRRGNSGALVVVELSSGVIYGHTNEERPPPTAQCRIDDATGNTSGRVHGCFPRADGYSGTVGSVVRTARSLPYGRLVNEDSFYMQRGLLYQLTDAHVIDIVWYRDAEEVQSEINEALYTMVGFVAGAVLINVGLCLVQVCLFERPLRSLARSVELLGQMDIEGAEENHTEHTSVGAFHVQEVVRLMRGFEAACVFLRQWRSFVPESLRCVADESTDVHSAPTPEQGVREDALRRVDSGAEDRSAGGGWAGSVGRQGEKVFHRLTDGTLRRKTGSIVLIDFGLDTTVEVHDLTVRAADFALRQLPPTLVEVSAAGGVVQQLSADKLLASWHTHRPCPDHSYNAARCSASVGYIEDSGNTVGCASGPVLVGHAGTESSRFPVLLGEAVLLAAALSRLAVSVCSPALITQRVYHATSGLLLARVVDVVSVAQQRPVRVYELLGEAGLQDEGPASPSYLEGFSALCQMDLERCIQQMVACLREEPTDRHAARLLRIALNFGRQRDSRQVYARRWQKPWEDLEDAAAGVPLPADLEGTPAADLWEASAESGFGRARLQQLRMLAKRGGSLCDADRLRVDIQKTLGQPIGGEEQEEDKAAANDGSRMSTSGSSSRVGGLRPGRRGSPPPASSSSSDSLDGRCCRPGESHEWARRSGSPGSTDADSQSSHQAHHDELPHTFVTGGGRKHRWTKSHKTLGKGAFGEVWMGMGEDGSLVALKALPLPKRVQRQARGPLRPRVQGSFDAADIEALVSEVTLMESVRHENVVSYRGSGVVGGNIVIVMEYMSGGSLQTMLEQFGSFNTQLPALRRYTGDILEGLDFLHSNSIAHRDLKPHNVLLTIEGQCKLADFGASGRLNELAAATKRGGLAIAGTPLYMSPEAAKGTAMGPADVWSLGVMLCQLWSGELPYTCATGNITFFLRGLAKGLLRPSLPDGMPADLRSMTNRCVCVDPEQRPTAKQLQSEPFFLAQGVQ